MKLVRRHGYGGSRQRYDSPALTRSASRVVPIALACASLLAAGCGGGTRQDASEPNGNFKVQVVRAEFPIKQSLAKRSLLVIAVKNVDSKTIPNIAVTVNSFDKRSTD